MRRAAYVGDAETQLETPARPRRSAAATALAFRRWELRRRRTSRHNLAAYIADFRYGKYTLGAEKARAGTMAAGCGGETGAMPVSTANGRSGKSTGVVWSMHTSSMDGMGLGNPAFNYANRRIEDGMTVSRLRFNKVAIVQRHSTGTEVSGTSENEPT